MNKEQLVSVYIPTHNRAELLSNAVKSVINQTYKNIEIIICNDGSTDNTDDVVNQLQKEYKDTFFVYLKNDVPMGACFSRNRCIAAASGYYLTGLDDDDYFLPNRIRTLIDTCDECETDLVCSNLIFKDRDRFKRGKNNSGIITSTDMGYENLVGNQLLTRLSFFKEVDGFDTNFPAWQDYDLWYRIIMKFGPCVKINEATYVMDVENDRKRISTSNKAHLGYKAFIEKHSGTLNDEMKESLFIRDLINRNKKIPLKTLLFSGRKIASIKHNIRLCFPVVNSIAAFVRK
ncbi:glycosyltransferase [Klebsiella aerogenes]|uniref:glycosyltransferase n=1 Tax=Klebsiella aerogenes TaxID=548 RepID=UPI0035155987|nr:glycosyltransferase [Klebsiella aerogenes]